MPSSSLPAAAGSTCRSGSTQPHVEIVVRDTGIGFSSSFQPHIFERFRQAESGPTRLHGGLGLGLAIARHIVEMHGGTINAESPGEGKGATFSVRLPMSSRAGEGLGYVVSGFSRTCDRASSSFPARVRRFT